MFLLICVLSLGLLISANAQTPMRVSDAADSVILKAYADTSNRSVCFQVRDFRPDSVIIDEPKKMQINKVASQCEGFNGTVAFVRDTSITPYNLDVLNMAVLQNYSYLIMVCGGQREGPGWTTVPLCRGKLLQPQAKQ